MKAEFWISFSHEKGAFSQKLDVLGLQKKLTVITGASYLLWIFTESRSSFFIATPLSLYLLVSLHNTAPLPFNFHNVETNNKRAPKTTLHFTARKRRGLVAPFHSVLAIYITSITVSIALSLVPLCNYTTNLCPVTGTSDVYNKISSHDGLVLCSYFHWTLPCAGYYYNSTWETVGIFSTLRLLYARRFACVVLHLFCLDQS